MDNPTKLKKMQLNSVDFVQRGANQEAHIMLGHIICALVEKTLF